MESSQAHQVNISDLDFAISTEPLQAIGNSHIFLADKYVAIYRDKGLLGIKPRQELAQWIPNHYQTYKLGQTLFNHMFGPGVAKVSFLSEDKSWMASLIGKASSSNHRTVAQEELFEELPFKHDALISELTKYNFKPSIGVVNGFDYNDSTAFYLLVEPHELGPDNLLTLTLASFKFSEREQHEIARLPRDQQEQYANQLLQAVAIKFTEELHAFLSLYYQLSQWPSQKEDLSAISLDLYNKNRNITSIAMDEQLANELKRFVSTADRYFRNETRMSSVIDFIMRYNEFYLGNANFYRSKIEQLFVRKKSYQKTVRVLGRSKPSSSDFEKYLAEQVYSYRDTKEILSANSQQYV